MILMRCANVVQEQERPLILIGHSFGGILIKKVSLENHLVAPLLTHVRHLHLLLSRPTMRVFIR